MKELLVGCLFFFCLSTIVACSQIKIEEKDTLEEEKIVVLLYGDGMMEGIGKSVCEALGAVCYNLNTEKEETIKDAIEEAEYLLLGTDKNMLEWEFALKKHFKDVDLQKKQIALFLLNQTEKKEQFENRFMEWQPNAKLLPTFTMEEKENLTIELGRMNGW